MDGFDKVAIGMCVLMILFCFYGCSQSIKQHADYRERCLASGGVPFQPKHDWVCLKKTQVQDMRM